MRIFDIDSPRDHQIIKQVSTEEYSSAIKRKLSQNLVAEPTKWIERMCSMKDTGVFSDNDKALIHIIGRVYGLNCGQKHQLSSTCTVSTGYCFEVWQTLVCFAISLIIKYRSQRKIDDASCLVTRNKKCTIDFCCTNFFYQFIYKYK